MCAEVLTREEAHRFREGAVQRRHAARDHVDSLSRVIASADVRDAALGRMAWGATTAEVMADELIALRAAEHEATADWRDARELCGLESRRP